MFDLRNYISLIKEEVEKVNKEDENWKWKVRTARKGHVFIWWEYIGSEKNDCFILECEDFWMFTRTPEGKMIDCYIVIDGTFLLEDDEVQSIESGIRDAIQAIARFAHDRY